MDSRWAERSNVFRLGPEADELYKTRVNIEHSYRKYMKKQNTPPPTIFYCYSLE